MTMIDPIGSTTSSTGATGPANPFATLANAQEFLQLLVAQLEYQDPLDPTSGTQFIAQSAQMAETAMIQELLTTEQQAAQASALGTAAGLIGRTVVASASDGSTLTGTVTSVTVDPTKGPMLDVGGTLVALSSVKEVT
jgi:flagellar basal-body rod modification protein FlgD